jgi:HAE1 family hydrophobic/amphiphilic exporter-1
MRPSPTSPPTCRTARCRRRWWSIATRPPSSASATDILRSTLYSGFGTDQVSTIYGSGDSYEVIVEFDPKDGWSPERMLAIQMRTASGSLVPLGAFARVERTAGLLTVNQLGQLPAVTISYNLPQGVALGDSVTRINALKTEIGLPTSISTTLCRHGQDLPGFARQPGSADRGAILTIYIVLGILYESFIHPLTILTGLPSAVLGARALRCSSPARSVGHRDHRHPDADRHRQEERDHDDRRRARTATRGQVGKEAIHKACLMRFRPIMMTTLAALMGTLPIALGTGASAELRQPLGVAVVGGLMPRRR